MDAVIQILIGHPLLTLFVIAAIGYQLGRIKIYGCGIGIAAVLFVGLFFGSLDPNLKLPEIVYVLGLLLFVYTIGLSSGPTFIASLRNEGLKENILTVAVLILATALTVAISWAIGLKATLSAGMFSGSLTNTPALAGILDTINRNTPGAMVDKIVSEPVIAYSIAYPMGVVGVMMAITLTKRLWKIDYEADAKAVRGVAGKGDSILTRTIIVTHDRATQESISAMFRHSDWCVAFGRIKRGEHFVVASGDEKLIIGDLVVLVGGEAELKRVGEFLGQPCETSIELDKSELDMRRIFVSSHDVVGKKLSDLKVDIDMGAVVTRVRRGDMDMVVHSDTILQLGDRVRVIAPRDMMAQVRAFFGDSYRAVSEVDILAFSLGLSIGLLIGIIPIPLPGGITVRLGFAGGPLIVGLVLGALGRTGSMVWSIPYSANTTLRQLGLILFLAGIGTRAGHGFGSTFLQGGGLSIFLAGGVITFTTAMLTLFAGYKLLHIPFSILIGMVSAVHTQPAVLGFALEEAKNELPNLGYSSVFPTATILKILLAQIILAPYLASL